MSEPIVATLELRLDDGNGDGDGSGDIGSGNNKISMSQMTNRLDGTGALLARCFPATDVKFMTTAGSVSPGAIRQLTLKTVVKFTDSDSAELQYPNAKNVTITPLVVLKKEKDAQGHTRIVPSTANFRFDSESNTIKVEALTSNGPGQLPTMQPTKVYATCQVSYSADYLVLHYYPGFAAYPRGGGSFIVGEIVGYNDYDVAFQEMELDLTSSPDWVEYARVVSKIVLDAEGTHEAPHGWPGNTKHDNGKELDPDNSFTDERTHCIVYVNTISSLRYEDFNNGGDGYWAWFDPQFGYVWTPDYELKFSDPPGGAKANSAADFRYDLNHRTWRDVFLEVDKQELRDRLSREYPGLSDGQKGGNY